MTHMPQTPVALGRQGALSILSYPLMHAWGVLGDLWCNGGSGGTSNFYPSLYCSAPLILRGLKIIISINLNCEAAGFLAHVCKLQCPRSFTACLVYLPTLIFHFFI